MISYHNVQTDVEKILAHSINKPKKEKTKRGLKFTIRSAMGILEIVTGENWLGYELKINEDIFGKSFGTSLDTDNYPLDYDVGVTNSIANEVLDVAIAFVYNRILGKKFDHSFLMAIPVRDKRIILKTYTPKRRWWNFDAYITETLPEEKIVEMGLKPITSFLNAS